jgi:hypothetical protein
LNEKRKFCTGLEKDIVSVFEQQMQQQTEIRQSAEKAANGSLIETESGPMIQPVEPVAVKKPAAPTLTHGGFCKKFVSDFDISEKKQTEAAVVVVPAVAKKADAAAKPVVAEKPVPVVLPVAEKKVIEDKPVEKKPEPVKAVEAPKPVAAKPTATPPAPVAAVVKNTNPAPAKTTPTKTTEPAPKPAEKAKDTVTPNSILVRRDLALANKALGLKNWETICSAYTSKLQATEIDLPDEEDTVNLVSNTDAFSAVLAFNKKDLIRTEQCGINIAEALITVAEEEGEEEDGGVRGEKFLDKKSNEKLLEKKSYGIK